MSLGRYSYFGNMFNMDAFRDDCEYAIFDDLPRGLRDMDFKFWLGGQLYFNVTDKYKHKRFLKWGRPAVYISNNNPLKDRYLSKSDKDWLEGNAVIVEVTAPLFK